MNRNSIHPLTSFILLLAVLGCGESVPTKANEKTESQTIPFTLTEFNNILITTTIDEKFQVDLMFHTAASSVCLTKDAVKSKTDLSLDQSETVKSWGGESELNYGEGHSLSIGDLEWTDVTITEDDHSGHMTDGKFGIDLFKGKIVELNFEKGEMRISEILPATIDEYDKLKISGGINGLVVSADLQIGATRISNRFLIHSGFGGSVLLDDQFVATNDLGNNLPTLTTSELKDAQGNILSTKKVMLPKMMIGKSEFENLPIAIFEGAIGRQKMSVLGGDILKRFNLIFDLQNKHLYLKQNSLFESAFRK